MVRQKLLDHFHKDNRNLFNDKSIEFCSKKGQIGPYNQDNFFIVVEGDIKIFGVCDGHGLEGHKISQFVMGNLLDYIKNSKCFRDLDMHDNSATDEEMSKAIKKAFKYAQDRTREQYAEFLVNEKRKKIVI